STSNSFPSGSAMTTQLTSPWPMSTRRGAQRLQPRHFGGLVFGPEVQVQPVLARLAVRNLQEQQVGDHAILRASLRRLQGHLVVLVEGTPPAQRGLPERRDLRRVTGIDAQALDANTHPP